MEEKKELEQITGKMVQLLLKLKTEEQPEKKGRWCGCCYESELDSFNGKYYE